MHRGIGPDTQGQFWTESSRFTGRYDTQPAEGKVPRSSLLGVRYARSVPGIANGGRRQVGNSTSTRVEVHELKLWEHHMLCQNRASHSAYASGEHTWGQFSWICIPDINYVDADSWIQVRGSELRVRQPCCHIVSHQLHAIRVGPRRGLVVAVCVRWLCVMITQDGCVRRCAQGIHDNVPICGRVLVNIFRSQLVSAEYDQVCTRISHQFFDVLD
eukprot:3011965-Rhodomonas_salina.5